MRDAGKVTQQNIAPPQQQDGGKLGFTSFSAVALGYTLRPPLPHVATNHQIQSTTLLVEKLAGLGHRRTGLYHLGMDPVTWTVAKDTSGQPGGCDSGAP